jgi:hypothetical protein
MAEASVLDRPDIHRTRWVGLKVPVVAPNGDVASSRRLEVRAPVLVTTSAAVNRIARAGQVGPS